MLDGMPRWICPECGRQFGRTKQGHECAPAMSLEDYFSTGPSFERPVFDAVMAGLRDLRDIHVEPVSVGIFLKRSRTFAELRPMTKWVAVSFTLERTLASRRIARKVIEVGHRRYHVVNVRSSDEVDDELLEWLVDAYDLCPE